MGLAQEVDQFAKNLTPEVRQSVHGSSKAKTEKRYASLAADYPDADALRRVAGDVKQHTLEYLDQYLEQAEKSLTDNGFAVHWASDGDAANRTVYDILRQRGAKRLVKTKSMVSEETELVPFLEKGGIEAVETDLGEFIIQLDHDHPSHIVTPIVHKNRQGVARTFQREKIAPDYNDDPETITRRARKHLRDKYLSADACLTGANFIIAETGQLVLVTNEGNAGFSMAAPPIMIAMVGIEKLLPRQRDLGLFLNLLGRSATGQQLTVYSEIVGGPRAPDRPHGPQEIHVIFIDNRRSEVLASDCRSILRCIRCGACLNVCPIYRQSSGHGYRSVYPGPVGAVLSPLLKGPEFPELADLPKASSLCGACNEVCPVDIPIPELLLRLRHKGKKEHAPKASVNTPSFGLWSIAASQPAAWKAGLRFGHAMNIAPHAVLNAAPPARSWQATRKLPRFRGGEFRKWMRDRSKSPNA
ncbi:MAG: lactate utilization protein B [Verrucomicrobiota bacterium]